LNHSRFRFLTRAEEICKLEGFLEGKQKGSVPFRSIQNQIKALKKPMKIDHSPSLRLMRNKHDISVSFDSRVHRCCGSSANIDNLGPYGFQDVSLKQKDNEEEGD
jgi:hypothetical protein